MSKYNIHNMSDTLQRLYIGANNKTHEVEIQKVVDFLTQKCKIKGFTIYKTIGYFEGKPEQGIVVDLIPYGHEQPNSITIAQVNELRKLLQQYSVILSNAFDWVNMSVEK